MPGASAAPSPSTPAVMVHFDILAGEASRPAARAEVSQEVQGLQAAQPAPPASSPGPWRRIAAAVAMFAVGGGLVARMTADDGGRSRCARHWSASPGGRSTPGDRARRPARVPGRELDGPPGSSFEYVVEAQPARGAPIPVGRFALTDGHGLLATTVAVDAEDLRSVRVFSMEGKLLYEASPAPVAGP